MSGRRGAGRGSTERRLQTIGAGPIQLFHCYKCPCTLVLLAITGFGFEPVSVRSYVGRGGGYFVTQARPNRRQQGRPMAALYKPSAHNYRSTIPRCLLAGASFQATHPCPPQLTLRKSFVSAKLCSDIDNLGWPVTPPGLCCCWLLPPRPSCCCWPVRRPPRGQRQPCPPAQVPGKSIYASARNRLTVLHWTSSLRTRDMQIACEHWLADVGPWYQPRGHAGLPLACLRHASRPMGLCSLHLSNVCLAHAQQNICYFLCVVHECHL